MVKGAQGNVSLNRASAHSRTNRSTADQVRSDYRSTYGLPWLTPQAEAERSWLPLAEAIAGEAAIPAGVIARHRSSLRSPVQVPDLFGVQDRRYLDRSGLVQQRDVADLMRYAALNQNADDFASFGGFIPIAADLKTRPDPEDRSLPGRFSDGQLYALALYLSSLKPPVNPNLPKTAPQVALVKRGEKIFHDSDNSCATCHKPPLYTNNKLMPVIGFDVPEDHRTKYDISDRRMDTDPGLTLETRRGTGYYKGHRCAASGCGTPLEHNGSCATLEDWFNPARIHDTYIPTGWKGPPGAKTRAVRGHEFGLDLSPEDKLALIAFLKTL